MMTLPLTLAAWQQPQFNDTFKQEVATLKDQLPLQQALKLSSNVSAEPIQVMILTQQDTADELHIRAGVFFTGIIAGCSCADDPSPLDTQNEYCEALFRINRQTAQTEVELL